MGQRLPVDFLRSYPPCTARNAYDFDSGEFMYKPRSDLGESVVQCLACGNKCELSPGQWGTCKTRLNSKGILKSLNYGRVDAMQSNPIEKKPFFHFLPNTDNLSLGGVGCNAHCEWCHNHESTQIEDMNYGVRLLRTVRPIDIVNQCIRHNLPSLSCTFNEPTINFEYYYEVCRLAKERGIMTVWVSNGFLTPEVVERLSPVLDGINIDLKTFREETYNQYCGLHLSVIKRTIKDFWKRGVWVEITTLLIPGINDSDEELTEMATWVASVSTDIPYHISAYRPANRMHASSTKPQDLLRAYKIAKQAGLTYVYLGNVPYGLLRGTEDTACPKCNTKLIERETYTVKVLWKKPGECHSCGTRLPGRWVNPGPQSVTATATAADTPAAQQQQPPLQQPQHPQPARASALSCRQGTITCAEASTSAILS